MDFLFFPSFLGEDFGSFVYFVFWGRGILGVVLN